MKIKVETNAQKTLGQLRENISAYKKLLSFQIFRALTLVETAIKKQLRGPSGLKVRTGRLLNTWGETKEVVETSTSVVGTMSSAGVPYARIHEFGGTILAKNKKLTIPLPGNRKSDGTPKMTIQEVFSSKKAFVTPKGAVMLERGRGKPTPMFVFKDKVNIPARPYIRPALAATQDKILKEFGLFLSATLLRKE